MATTISGNGVDKVLDTADLSTNDSIEALETQLATAWVSFSGITTASILDNYNISTVTRTASGRYTITFAVAMDNTGYTIGGSGGSDGVGNRYFSVDSKTVTECTLVFESSAGSELDVSFGHVQIFGGKA